LDHRCVRRGEGLGGQARLAHARVADDCDELAALLRPRPLPRLADQQKFALAADEAGLVAPLGRLQHSQQPVGRHWLCLAFQVERLDRFGLHCLANELECRLAEQHLARLGRLLESCGHVHRVPRRQALFRSGDDDAGGQPDAGLDAELRERVAHLHGRAYSPQRVVFVCRRHAEDRHHRIADELLDGAPVSLDDRLHALEVAGEQPAKRLRVDRLAERR
jgi:hypothetical protein